jgi:hypothetical protein
MLPCHDTSTRYTNIFSGQHDGIQHDGKFHDGSTVAHDGSSDNDGKYEHDGIKCLSRCGKDDVVIMFSKTANDQPDVYSPCSRTQSELFIVLDSLRLLSIEMCTPAYLVLAPFLGVRPGCLPGARVPHSCSLLSLTKF